jgi:hypothetical protein
MKRFTIQSPEGINFTIEGEQEPTQEEMAEIFSQIQAETPQELPAQKEVVEPNKELSKLQKFTVGAIPVATSIIGGIAGAPAGLPGIIAGGSAGAYSGRMISDNLEAVFGGEKRTQEEMFKRASKDALIDAGFTVGTMGVGKALKITGGDKVIKSVASKAFKPIKDAFIKSAKPSMIAKEAKDVIKQADKRLLEIDFSLSKMTDDLIENTAEFTKKELKISNEMLGKYTDNVANVITKLKPELDKGVGLARNTISSGYNDLLEGVGNIPIDINKKNLRANLKNINIENSIIDDIISVIPEQETVLFSDMHNLKLKLDDTISMLKSGKDKVAKRVIGNLGEFRDGISERLGKYSNGIYSELSENYKRLLEVEKNIDNALGKTSSGAVSGVRGRTIEDLFTKENIKKLPKDYDVLSETTGRIGRINSQINLLENIGTDETINSANKMREGLQNLYSSTIKKINYEDMFNTYKKINLKAIDGKNISMDDLRDISVPIDITPTKEKISIQELIKKRENINKIKAEEKTLKARKKQQQLALSASSEMFHSYNDKYMPMMGAVSLGYIFPALKTKAVATAGIYTLYKMKSILAHNAIEAITQINKQATKQLSKVPFSQKHQIVYSKFATGLINKIIDEEEDIYDPNYDYSEME